MVGSGEHEHNYMDLMTLIASWSSEPRCNVYVRVYDHSSFISVSVSVLFYIKLNILFMFVCNKHVYSTAYEHVQCRLPIQMNKMAFSGICHLVSLHCDRSNQFARLITITLSYTLSFSFVRLFRTFAYKSI